MREITLKQFVHASSKVLNFLQQFGIDPTKEAEVWRAVPNENGYDTYFCGLSFYEGYSAY